MAKKEQVPAIRFQGFADPWEQRKLSEVFSSYTDPVDIPHDGYERLGIRSHAKGTFHSYVPAGHELQTAQMHRVAANKFIVNITFGWEHAVAVTDENDAGKLVSHRFPQFSLSDELDPQFLKFIILDERFRHHLWLASPGGAGRNRVLNLNQMLQYEIQIPCVAEQRKIAGALINIDILITLHQRKYDKLVAIKRSMLEKMFPREGSRFPEIRFAGFTDPWEQRKFNDVFSILQNCTLSRAELSYDNGEAFNIHYGDVLIKFGEVIDAETALLPRITDEKIVASFRSSALQDGDIIIADTAEDEAVGKCAEMLNLQEKTAISGLHTIPVRPTARFATGYLGYFMNSPAFHDQLLPLMQGTKVTSVSKSALQDTVISFPSERAEQGQIGRYFMALDTLITLHQRKLEKLQAIKRSMLEKMFV